MARSDMKSSRRSYGGRGYSYNTYNDEGRGKSASLWEEFESYFSNSGFDKDWLLNAKLAQPGSLDQGLYDNRLYTYVHDMTWRYSIHDWAFKKFEDEIGNDGRVRRLVISKCGEIVWQQLQHRAKLVWEEALEAQRKEAAERSEQWEQERAIFKAERIQRETEEVQRITKEIDLVAGALRSDFLSAFSNHDVYYRREGDWLDDPVSGMVTGHGFGYEEQHQDGIKLQITVSLDRSNSMYYNRLSKAAAQAFRDIWLAMEQLEQEHPTDLFIAAFDFAVDGYEASERGRVANCLSVNRYSDDKRRSTDTKLGAVELYRDPDGASHQFSGEDTWFYPLFDQIQLWEGKHSDPGAYKLDLIITDAVIEHPSDIRRSDKIQEYRDGSLQTVMLNFLPEDEWVNSDLPLRCVQYGANVDNIGGLLRTIITQFVSMYI